MDTYRVAAQVNLAAVRHNLTAMKQTFQPGTRLCAVIKTDGYGHGAVQVAHCARGVAEWFAVATIDEALDLRQHGVSEPVLILGYVHPDYDEQLIRYDIRPNIDSLERARLLSQTALKVGKPAKIHIKIDTGMSRLGFLVNEQSVEEIAQIAHLPGLEAEGIFTHFTASDEADKTKTLAQLGQFQWMLDKLEEKGVTFPICHCANSGGILDGIGRSFDMVRSGIITYGLYPSDEVNREALPLIPALELKSHIVHLKTLPPGTGISYGSTFVTERVTRVATVPVGYGDGYPRLLSNRGEVLIRGQRARILGRVCMDQFMADVTDIPGVSMGDKVTLIGRDGQDCILADELAKLCGTINYEILCGLGSRIPRVYLPWEGTD